MPTFGGRFPQAADGGRGGAGGAGTGRCEVESLCAECRSRGPAAVSRRRATRVPARLRAGGPRRLGGSDRVLGAESWLWGAARTSSPCTGRGAGGGSEPRLAGPRCAATGPSKSAPSSVVTEVTRELLGRCAPAQLLDVLVFEDCSPMDGVLQPFELGLQMLEPRLELLHPVLPGGVRRWRARSPPIAIATPPPGLSQPLCEGGRLRLCRPWAWREVAGVPSLHCSTPGPLVSVAREEEGTRPNGRIGGRPRGSRSLPQAPRLGARFALRLLSGSGLKSCPRGQSTTHLTPFPAVHECHFAGGLLVARARLLRLRLSRTQAVRAHPTRAPDSGGAHAAPSSGVTRVGWRSPAPLTAPP